MAEPASLVLRERNFRFALLNRSDLHRADLTWADLRAAQLWRTTMRGKLNDTQAQGAVLKEAALQGAQIGLGRGQGSFRITDLLALAPAALGLGAIVLVGRLALRPEVAPTE